VGGKGTVVDAAGGAGVSERTLRRWFSPFWKRPPHPTGRVRSRVLVVDAVTVVRREAVALVAGDPGTSGPVGWAFAARECRGAWSGFLSGLKRRGANPACVVSDGQKGLLKAVREVWPNTLTQRCVVHVHRQAMAWLTRNPKTDAGLRLRPVVSALLLVVTSAERDAWLDSFRSWEREHGDFLKERTSGESGWWYTHRRLRAVRSLLRNASPNLFRYVDDPSVPRTSNHVEGGLNSRIKELLRSHRGITKRQRLALVCWHLHCRRRGKTTRNVR